MDTLLVLGSQRQRAYYIERKIHNVFRSNRSWEFQRICFNCNGEVIGIATLGRDDALAMNYAIPISVVKNFIEKVKDKEEVEVALKISEI